MLTEIVNHLWQSTLIAFGVAALAATLRDHGAHARYWLWWAASVKFLVPFFLLSMLGSSARRSGRAAVRRRRLAGHDRHPRAADARGGLMDAARARAARRLGARVLGRRRRVGFTRTESPRAAARVAAVRGGVAARRESPSRSVRRRACSSRRS